MGALKYCLRCNIPLPAPWDTEVFTIKEIVKYAFCIDDFNQLGPACPNCNLDTNYHRDEFIDALAVLLEERLIK